MANRKGDGLPMDSPNNSPFPRGCKVDLYARAAATLYGIISFDDFFKILDTYYGEGSFSKERIMQYFWSAKNDDPMYYVQDELIVHSSISPDEIKHTLFEIQHPVGVTAPKQHKILPEKEFLMYANPLFYEHSAGAEKMEAYLTDDLGIAPEDVKEIVAEMTFICRTGSSPILLMDALSRRGYPFGKECDLDLIVLGSELEAGTRMWERLGATGREMAGR